VPRRRWGVESAMPEGPEIRRAADRVAAAIENRVADAARLEEPRFRGRQFGALLLDQRFVVGGGKCLRCPSCQPRRKRESRRSSPIR